MHVSITIDMDSSTDAERNAEIRRLLILADLLACGATSLWCNDHVVDALRAATRTR